MKLFVLYSILLGMMLINAPKSLLHECVHEDHKCHHNQINTDFHQDGEETSIEIADCDQCSYYFQSIDTPNFPLRFLSVNGSYDPLAMNSLSVSIGTIQYLKLRGPPAIVMI
jgi:hypothetical protein